MMEESKVLKLIETVRQTAYDLHVYLGNGYLEKVYENALKNRLRKRGFNVETQVPLQVYDEDGAEIGDYQADMLVEKSLIVELKAAKAITPEHYAQTMNYLKTTGLRYALLINFGSYKFEVRRIVSNFKPCRDVKNVEGCEWREASGSGATPQFKTSTRSTFLHGSKNKPCREEENVEANGSCEASTRSTLLHGQNSCAAGSQPTSTSSTLLHG